MKRNVTTGWPALLLFGALIACGAGGDGNESGSQPAMVETAETKPVAQRVQDIRADVKAVKAALAQQGDYNCCVQPACDWCLLHEGECDCYENLKAGKEVCPGCGLGWHNGEGVVEGMSAEEVKWDIRHEHGEVGHQH